MFITYEGQTVTINEVLFDHTANITYTDSNGEEVSTHVCLEELEGGDFPRVNWDEVVFDCLSQKVDEYWDYDFSDGDARRLISISYDVAGNGWYGHVFFSETEEGNFDYAEVALTDEDLKKLVKLIPSNELHPLCQKHEEMFVLTHRWDQYMSMDVEIFSDWDRAKNAFDQLVHEYDDQLDHEFGSEEEKFILRENVDEGNSVRLERLPVTS
jgi:hypothetical protein